MDRPSRSLRVVSLFCGCGGMDLGVIGGFTFLGKTYSKLPFNIVYAIDNDPYAVAIYNDNFTHPCTNADVRQIVPKSIPSHDLLIGGFPCQSFSISAQNPPRLGYKDDRGKLFFEMVKILEEKRPRFFIAENVKGILSANNKQVFPMIINAFENVGYHIMYKLVNASNYGIPQKRERVIIIGFKNKKDYRAYNFPKPVKKKRVLGEVIDVSANANEHWFFSEKAVQGMLKVRDKMNKGRVQSLDAPCNTISSHLAKVSLNATDPVFMVDDRYRRFTPKEVASIQSFPKSFSFNSVSDCRKYKAIGNAVPPVLMWHITRELSKII